MTSCTIIVTDANAPLIPRVVGHRSITSTAIYTGASAESIQGF